jgi:hypothetical protein
MGGKKILDVGCWMNFRQEDRICRKGADNGVDFGIGKHFRQEDRICRKGDCGEAAVAGCW